MGSEGAFAVVEDEAVLIWWILSYVTCSSKYCMLCFEVE